MMLLPLLVLASPLLQEPEAPEPLPPGIVARVGDREVTRQEYLDFLYVRFGKRALNEYLSNILLEQEAARYGIAVDEEEIDRLVEEREEAARNNPRGGIFEEDLQRNGQSLEMFRSVIRTEVRRDRLSHALVMATRVVTDDKLRQEFEREYGAGGVRLQVRHMVVMPNFLKAERIRAGAKPNEVDMEEVRAEARRLAERGRERVLGGEDFASVVAEVSHDRVTRDKGGEIANYNGRLYGPAFRAALDTLQPGDVSAVVESGAGFHVIQLVDRTETSLDSVREALTQRMLEAEPTFQEKSALIQAITNRADIQLW